MKEQFANTTAHYLNGGNVMLPVACHRRAYSGRKSAVKFALRGRNGEQILISDVDTKAIYGLGYFRNGGTPAMKLYHFTSTRHLSAIARYGLTVGDVPTDIHRERGRVGIWLTSAASADGHGLHGGAADKGRIRLMIEAPENSALVRWTDWAPRNVTPETLQALHATARAFKTWYVFFGVIERPWILECLDMQTGELVENWSERLPSPLDIDAVPPNRRAQWHKKMLKQVRRALHARRASREPAGPQSI